MTCILFNRLQEAESAPLHVLRQEAINVSYEQLEAIVDSLRKLSYIAAARVLAASGNFWEANKTLGEHLETADKKERITIEDLIGTFKREQYALATYNLTVDELRMYREEHGGTFPKKVPSNVHY